MHDVNINLSKLTVKHDIFGEGTIISLNDSYISIRFSAGEKKFIFPDGFISFLSTDNPELNDMIRVSLYEKEALIKRKEQERKEKELEYQKNQVYRSKDNKRSKVLNKKKNTRENIAFKCNYCNGGASDISVGFKGVCSDDLIDYNIRIAKHVWCCDKDSFCLRYYNGEISRDELDKVMIDNGWVCYESQMLKNWIAYAGIFQSGDRRGQAMKLSQAVAHNLCVLTTRKPNAKEESRFIFAVFLIDETYEGDLKQEGYVTTSSQYKIELTPKEAEKFLFWDYHSNTNKPDVAAWNSGLHRYLNDTEAAQMLRDICKLKKGTKDEDLAKRFYLRFCSLNEIDPDFLPDPSGATNSHI